MTPSKSSQLSPLRSWLDQPAWSQTVFINLLQTITRLIRAGDYRPDLLDIAGRLLEEPDRLRELDYVGYLRSRSLAAEIFHYFGRQKEAETAVREESEKALRELESMETPPRSLAERLELRQKCWMAVVYAQVEPYRHHDYERALAILSRCSGVVERLMVQKQDFPLYGLRAQIAYLLGQVHRAEGTYPKADKELGRALKFSRLRLESRTVEAEKIEQWDRVEFEQLFANHFAGLVLGLGLGWIRYQKGLLRQATPHAESAHMLLYSSNDPINKALVLLLLAHIERAESGPERERAQETVRKIKKVLEVFERGPYRHAVYETRARCALANTYLSTGNTADADIQCGHVTRLADEIADPRWQCNALLLKSRIVMNQYPDQAKCLADQALTKAREGGKIKHITCEIEALLVRGEAKYVLKDYRGARDDLTRPKEQYKDHMTKKWQAECSLRLARIAMQMNEPELADRHLDEWRVLAKDVEFHSVKELAGTVQAERGRAADNFYISKDEVNLSYDEHQAQLKRFLLARAKERGQTQEEVSKLLGVSRQTLHNWSEKKGAG